MADLGPCSECAASGSGMALDNRPLCDRCGDRRLAAITGWPLLPRPPGAEVIVGPDRERHFVRYRVLRMPGGIVALAEELGSATGSSYRLELRCDHTDDPAALVERIRNEARAAIAHPYLVPSDEWQDRTIVGDILAGRLEEADADNDVHSTMAGPDVIVDGHALAWAELGELLQPYVGWSFELRLGGDLTSRDRGDTFETIVVRTPTSTDRRAAARALASSRGAYILDSAHYPTPEQWAQRDSSAGT